eukprot:4850460-Amphidinium_carterae.1
MHTPGAARPLGLKTHVQSIYTLRSMHSVISQVAFICVGATATTAGLIGLPHHKDVQQEHTRPIV